MWPHSFDCVQPVDRAIAVRCEDEVTGMDQSRKTMRHFYCRDVLWETFEAMAADFDCSVDYLVNEAMRIYARSKNYQVPSGSGSTNQVSHSGRLRSNRCDMSRDINRSSAASSPGAGRAEWRTWYSMLK